MQDLLSEEDFLAMTEQRIDLNMLTRIDGEQKATSSRVDAVDARLSNIENDIAEIKGTIKPKELPAGVRFILFPLTVAALAGIMGAVIHLEITVAGMQNSMGVVQGALAKQTLTTDAALPTSEFKVVLPELASAIAVTRRQKVKVLPQIISDLQQHLTATDTDAPSFWPAVSEFISYKSLNSTSWSAPNNLPTCTDSEPASSTVSILSPTQATINPGVYENCRFILDSPREDARLNEIIQKRLAVVIFKHCVIVYRGGPINLVLALDKYNLPWSTEQNGQHLEGRVNISVRNAVQFQECLFDFVLHGEPQKSGRELTKFLLASSGNEITVPLTMPSNPS